MAHFDFKLSRREFRSWGTLLADSGRKAFRARPVETEMTEGSGLRWGILGCGNIAGKFAGDLAAHGIPVAAAASRDAARARSFAGLHGIPAAYGDYPALLADPHVDAIYIALPNPMHAEWSMRAARAGKHVLCEKPASLTEHEAEAMIAAARNAKVFFMEGFMYALHPQWGLARNLVDDGAIGPVHSLSAVFGYDLGQRPGNIRLSPEALGGALNDVGCYGVHFARAFSAQPFGRDAVRIGSVRAHLGPEGVDEWMEIALDLPVGIRAEIFCALREARPPRAVIAGERGRIEISQPWHPPAQGAEVRLSNGNGDRVYQAGDGLAAFAREALEVEKHASMGQSPILPWEDTLAQARTMERAREAIDWV